MQLARTLYEESLALCQGTGRQGLIASALEGLAGVVAAQGDPTWAALLWGAVKFPTCSCGEHLSRPSIRLTMSSQSLTARAQLGKKTFTTAWAEGTQIWHRSKPWPTGNRCPEPIPRSLSCPIPHLQPCLRIMLDSPLREMDVLRLLAQGLTSAQIAERLVIGVVTVNFHVRSIYSKLGITSSKRRDPVCAGTPPSCEPSHFLSRCVLLAQFSSSQTSMHLRALCPSETPSILTGILRTSCFLLLVRNPQF